MFAATLAGCGDPSVSGQTAPIASGADASERSPGHADPEYKKNLERCRQTALDLPLSDLQAQGAVAGAATATSRSCPYQSPCHRL